MTMFDKDALLNAQAEAPMDTKYTPFPMGEYAGYIDKLDTRVVGEAKDRVVLDAYWVTDDPAVKEVTGMDKATCRQSIFLDLTPTGGLDTAKGKNVQLGKLREAVGQNGEGAWSPAMLAGAPGVFRVEHSPGKNDGEVYANVVAVRAIQ